MESVLRKSGFELTLSRKDLPEEIFSYVDRSVLVYSSGTQRATPYQSTCLH